MYIGTSLFSKLAAQGFSRLQSTISDLQGRISEGTNDPRPSSDPARAARLSAVSEQVNALDRYKAATATAADRLAYADTALEETGNLVRQMQSLALQAANDTQTSEGIAALHAQAVAIKQALLTAANSKDANGQPLFSGYGADAPFATDAGGQVHYQGDGGRPFLRISDTTTLATGVNGAETFMSVKVTAQDGSTRQRSLFDMADDLIASLGPNLAQARSSVQTSDQSAGQALLVPRATSGPATISFTLKGRSGQADITATVQPGPPNALIAAINAQTGTTGITAQLSADGTGVVLQGQAGIGLQDLSLSGAGAGDARAPVADFTPLDSQGVASGTTVALRDKGMASTALVGLFSDATTQIASARAEVGSLAALADSHTEALAARRVKLESAVSDLRDLDVAAALTQLQTLLTNQQAAQQTFIKINSASLFNYLK